ncbi:MAG TPA: sialate O-acetylesterase, partial [Niabella sp.]|nr:sialate O-acetylesterase [Niabella sp.]
PFPDLYSAAKAVHDRKANPDLERSRKAFMEWSQKMLQKDAGYINGTPAWSATTLADKEGWKQMLLPSSWENKGLVDFDGSVWFRKKIQLEKDWANEDAYLTFMADDDDIAWFNGKQIGAAYGWDIKRRYRIPKELMQEGENSIVIRVFDTGGGGGIYADEFELRTNTGSSIDLSGVWEYKTGFELKETVVRPSEDQGPNRPTVLYNGMIYPLSNYAIKGVIWYQGESNVARAAQYRTLFPALIKCWRNTFRAPAMPFYFVQLAGYMQPDSVPVNSQWALLREAQDITASLPHTGMATAIDIGDATDIHPKNKQEVGRRLALLALAKDYKKEVAFSGPRFQSYRVEGNTVRLRFTHAQGMHTSNNEPVKSIAIAGSDKKFYWATAQITGNEIIVSAPQGTNPVAVRYAWANNPDGNLYNSANLPALPFRTDSW